MDDFVDAISESLDIAAWLWPDVHIGKPLIPPYVLIKAKIKKDRPHVHCVIPGDTRDSKRPLSSRCLKRNGITDVFAISETKIFAHNDSVSRSDGFIDITGGSNKNQRVAIGPST